TFLDMVITLLFCADTLRTPLEPRIHGLKQDGRRHHRACKSCEFSLPALRWTTPENLAQGRLPRRRLGGKAGEKGVLFLPILQMFPIEWKRALRFFHTAGFSAAPQR